MTEGVVQGKGKEKVVEEAADPADCDGGGDHQVDRLSGGAVSLQPSSEAEAAPSCGICLCELLERGRLDSCDHVFCFDCIYKWSKVESRCPMCKRRFTRIKKEEVGSEDTRKGTLTVQRSFRIPSRNQTYQVPEEELQAFQDPYATTVCLACGAGTDDALMLLCDGCDGAYHTYCVGFGQQVPLGAFYCANCQAAATTPMQLEEFCTDDDEDLRDIDYDASEDGIVPSTSATRPARPARVLRSQRASTARTVGTTRSRGSGRRRGVSRASRLRVFVGAIRRQRRGTSRRMQELLEEPVLQQAVAAPRLRETAAHSLVDRMREQWQSIRQGQLQFSDVTPRTTSSVTTRRPAAVRPTDASAQSANPRMSSDEARAWAIADQLRARAAASQRDASPQPTTSRTSADIQPASTLGRRRSLSSLGPSSQMQREGNLRTASYRQQEDLDAGHPSTSHRDYQFHTENLYRGARRSPRGRHTYSRPEVIMQPPPHSRAQVSPNRSRQQPDMRLQAGTCWQGCDGLCTHTVQNSQALGNVHARGVANTAIAAGVQPPIQQAARALEEAARVLVSEAAAGGSLPAVSTAERAALKELIAKLVKQAMLPLYQSKRMDRDAFKQTAKDATHSVLHKALHIAERTDAVLETLVRQALAPTLAQFEL
eukprot:jgi/Chlat1/5551/Chrsp369S05351